MNVFLYKKPDPKQGKEYDHEYGERDPAAGRDTPFGPWQKSTSARGTTVASLHITGVCVLSRSRAGRHDNVNFLFSRVALCLEFVGFPRVWARLSVFLLRNVILLLKLFVGSSYPGTAEPTKLALRVI